MSGELLLNLEDWNSMMKASMTKAVKMLRKTMTQTKWNMRKKRRDAFDVT
jgi:hypothetical protein